MTHHEIASPPLVARAADATPSTRGLVAAVAASAGRQVGWGLGGVSRELAGWRARAARIPDPTLRADALGSLQKRYYVDGAALFWILPARRDRELLALLVAYQTIANYLDYASERGAARARGTGRQPDAGAGRRGRRRRTPLRTTTRDHPWQDDGGYLAALVARCRRACAALPRYPEARPLLLAQARLGRALELCHDPDGRAARRRAAALADECRRSPASRGSSGRAARRRCWASSCCWRWPPIRRRRRERLRAAMAPTSRGSGPQPDARQLHRPGRRRADPELERHRLLPGPGTAERRVATLIARALGEIATLHRGERHTLIVSAMLAMYLTSDDATAPGRAEGTRALRRAGGPLTRRAGADPAGLAAALRPTALMFHSGIVHSGSTPLRVL